MAEDKRLYVNKKVRNYVDNVLQGNDLLGFKDGAVSTTETFMLLTALGIDNPISPQSRGESYIRDATIQSLEKAMLSAVLLGTAKNNDDINAFANYDTIYKYCEKCAEGGFENLQQRIEDADYDNEILEQRLSKWLDDLYMTEIKGYIEE